MRSSPSNGVSTPPLKKKVTWAYFSVSAQPGGGQHLRYDAVERHQREQRFQEAVEVSGVFNHADGGGEIHLPRAQKPVEGGVQQRSENFARTVGAEVGHYNAVAVPHAGIVADRRGQNELVGHPASVAGLHRGHRLLRAFALARHQHGVGLCDPVPPLVAVHGVIAPANRGDGGAAQPGNVTAQLFEINRGRRRRGVPPVEKGVYRHRNARAVEDAGQHGHVVLMRMHAAGGYQPQQVAGAAAFFQPPDQPRQGGVGGQCAVRDGGIDAADVLIDDAAGAEVEMADLGIAHLAAGQPDLGAAGLQQRLRARRHEPVVDRRRGLGDGVVLGFRAVAPAVQYAQHHWPGLHGLVHGNTLYSVRRVRRTEYRSNINNPVTMARARRGEVPSFPVIGVAGEDLLGAVELFQQHAAHHQVRPRHGA